MHLFDRRLILVKEHVALLKLSGAYDLLDPETKQVVGIAQEKISGWIKFFRLLVNKRLMPTRVEVAVASGQPPLLVIKRGVQLFRARVDVLDGSGQLLGFMKSKIFSLGGGFLVYSADGQQFADVKGDWKGWNFKMLDGAGREMGTVTKKWAGLGKELFTSADNYIIQVNEGAANAPLLLAAALAVDLVFKEKE